MVGSATSRRRCAGLAAALVAIAWLGTAATPPAAAATGRVYVSNGLSHTVSVLDPATNSVVATVPVDRFPGRLAVSPDRTRVYVVHPSGNTVSVISTASDTVVATVPVVERPSGVAVSPDGSRVWVAGRGISVIDTASNAVVTTHSGLSFASDLAFSPDGTRVYVAGDDRLVVFDAATVTETARVPAGHTPADVELSLDGGRVYVHDAPAFLSSFDTATNVRRATVQLVGGSRGMAVSPDGTRLYIAQFGPAGVLVLDAASLAALAIIPVGFETLDVGVSPEGDRLYVTGVVPGTQEGRLAVVDTATGTVVTTVAVGRNPHHVAVARSSPPPPPAPPPPAPPSPVVEGATFYTDGSSARSGVAPGARVSLFTSSASPGLDYRLVLSHDGCRTVLAVLNPTARFATDSGVIGPTAGNLPAGLAPGRYQICFRAVVSGSAATITGPVTLDVV